jgi:amidase
MTDTAYLPALTLAAMVRRREVGCVELLEHFLARVAAFDGEINALCQLDPDTARDRARAADRAIARGDPTGPLHGVPMTVKEAFDVAGLVTTWGLEAEAENRATANAAAVDALLRAGANIFGKTNVPVMLADWQSYNPVYGTTNNPYDLSRTPGGSSGGAAAALAAGLTPLEIGSDIGGSIRNPAHFCGVFGHKPSFGLVPQDGHAPSYHRSPLDVVGIGPLARTAGDLDAALSVIAGPEPEDAGAWSLRLPPPRTGGLRGARLAVLVGTQAHPVDATVAGLMEAAADAAGRAGARVDRAPSLPVDLDEADHLYVQLLRGATSARVPEPMLARLAEVHAARGPDDDPHLVRGNAGVFQSHRDWTVANERRHHLRAAWARFFEEYDALLCPIAPTPAYPHDQAGDRTERRILIDGREGHYFEQLFWAGVPNVACLPSTALPIGQSADGLPVGIQIVGPYLGDRSTIALAAAFEEAGCAFSPPPRYRAGP